MRADEALPVELPVAEPRFVATHGRWLFTWHHRPLSPARRGASVVLCPPLGFEYMSAYATFRILAGQIAALGFDVLRLDYDGTGNSSGDYHDPDRAGAWNRSVTLAIHEARRLTGSGVVALVGFRAGAILALQAAAETGGVERLVLWNPFASGHAYVRELKALAGLSRQDHALDESDARGVNVAGHLVTHETIDALDRWTLDAIPNRPARDVLIVDRDDRPAPSTVDARLEHLGARVTRIRPGGTSAMLALPHVAKVPEEVLHGITAWLDGWDVSNRSAVETPDVGRCDMAPAGTCCGERAIRFGPGGRLFGIVDSPAAEASVTPAIILLNTGVEYHVGPHRMYVPLAREWAARGHLVLRFDLGGIGDSLPPGAAAGNAAYPDHMLDDLRHAIAWVRQAAPHRQVVVAGICSGGWLAFRAARDGLAVDAIVSVNPPLYLRDGSAGTQWLSQEHEFERYHRAMRDGSKWMKALRGEASYRGFVRIAARALARRATVRLSGVLGHSLPDGLANDLCTIANRGIVSLFVFSGGDQGLEYFQVHAPPAFRRDRVRRFVRHMVVDGAGHTFRPSSSQQTLRQVLTDFVAARTASPATPDDGGCRHVSRSVRAGLERSGT
ncbi:MAG: alpha/beta fold hydrolase [Vicinamibacterales bacterium]